MDCNREEAMRAKQIAEKKMENKDFSGALKIAIKAQQLYPELENVSQMILVCEVHCSAEKMYGSEKDWYGILKIEPSADDLSIKKQYRKLALVLHPDKNKFSGSTDAFKLIGEAQRVLLDHDKRMIHDSKRRSLANISGRNWIPKQPSRQSNAHHPWNQSSFAQAHSANSHFPGGRSGNFQVPQQRTQTGVSGNRPTFWTVCPFCSVRYQFYRDDVLNKVIHCQSCKKSFTAYELNVQGAATGVNLTRHPPFTPQNKVPSKNTEGANRNFTSKPVPGGVNQRKEHPKPQGNANRKRKKKVEESSESSDSESSSESEDDDEEHSESSNNENSTGSDDNGVPENVDKNPADQESQYFGEQPRRSSRPKRNVSYKENLNDNDDDASPSNQAKKRDSSFHHSESRVEDTFWKEEVRKSVKEDNKNEFQTKEDDKEPKQEEHKIADDDMEEMEPEVYECPDPEFTDFEKDRKETSFAPGQIWAVYDTEDAMPRFYAFIRKVESPGFKLQITWLKAIPDSNDEAKWLKQDLPVSCGMYKRGKLDQAEDLPMFSHLVSWESQKTTIVIVPRKGETWALFQNWSIKWHSSDQDDTRKYEYEFVEILSDYDHDVGVRVSYLEKVKGFVSLFRRKEDGETLVGASEKYRFSHMVPSRRMSGEERDGVPKGCYELDPAGLPSSAFEADGL